MYKFYFEKLEVWQNARKFVKDIYKVTEAFKRRTIWNNKSNKKGIFKYNGKYFRGIFKTI